MKRRTISELASSRVVETDLLICSASFERRCIPIPKALHEAVSRSGTEVLIGYNENYRDRVRENLELLNKIFPSAHPCALHTDDPILTADALMQGMDALWPKEKRPRVSVDITAFTRESLLMLLQALWRRGSYCDVTLLYLRAKEYDVGSIEEQKWLSQGIREVRSVIGYPGDLLPTRPTHLIVLAGFERDRGIRLIADCEPSVVSLGVADPSDADTQDHQRTNEIRMREIRNLVAPVHEFQFSAYDPYRAADALKRQMEEVQEETNTIIAPMNTKISTVGAGMVGWEIPNVQLCYAQADMYNYDRYSSPGEVVYEFPLPWLDPSKIWN